MARQHTQQSMINKQLKVKPGEPLSQNALFSSESHLYNLGVFDWAEVDPKRAITDQHQEDVVVKVHEGKRNSIVYGFGFQVVNRGGSVPSGTVVVPGIPPVGLPPNFRTSEKTFWGPEGTFEYTRRNLRGRARVVHGQRVCRTAGPAGQLRLHRPFVPRQQLEGQRHPLRRTQQPESHIHRANWKPGLSLEKPLNAKKTTHLFLRYNFQLTRISNLLIPELVPPNQLNVHLSTVSASWIHDTRDNVLDAHRGIYQSYELGVNPVMAGLELQLRHVSGTDRVLQGHRQRDRLGEQHPGGTGAGLCRQRSAAQPAFLLRRRQHVARISA